MPDRVRIGVIGAGGFSRGRILPGFQKAPATELTIVANRTRASAERVAAEFEIPRVADDWRQVVESPEVDAVFVGTPPYVHREITLAALEAGKHVLLQTRMAMSAAEAREMHAVAERAKAGGVRTMLVPPNPFHRGARFVRHLIESGYLGALRYVAGFNWASTFANPSAPLSEGRNDLALYGRYNAGQLGLYYDALNRWTGFATNVVAQRTTYVSQRPLTPGGPMAENPYPDQVTTVSDTESGAVLANVFNWSVHFGEARAELYGSEGTLVYFQRRDAILMARAGEQALKETPIPPEHDAPWRAEEEFVRLVRGEIEEASFTFWDGVKNMEYLEAAYVAATEGRRVELP